MSGIKPQLQHKGGEDVSWFVIKWPGKLTHSKWRTGCLGWTQHGPPPPPPRAHENAYNVHYKYIQNKGWDVFSV